MYQTNRFLLHLKNNFKQSWNTSSARVDEHGRFLHFSELFDVEQVLGFRSQRTVDNHEVGFWKQLIQVNELGSIFDL